MLKVNDLVKKYDVSKREIDYWTNLGLLTPEKVEENGYRLYGEKSEEELKMILIANSMGCKISEEELKMILIVNSIGHKTSLAKTVIMLQNLPKEFWDTVVVKIINDEFDKITEKYKKALKWAKEMKEKS